MQAGYDALAPRFGVWTDRVELCRTISPSGCRCAPACSTWVAARALFHKIARWLKPGGILLASLRHVGGEDRTEQWLGVEIFFSGVDADTNRRLLSEAGFQLLVDELVWIRKPQGEVAFLWVLAQS